MFGWGDDLYVMSWKDNSSRCKMLICSGLCAFVMSDEFLRKLFYDYIALSFLI